MAYRATDSLFWPGISSDITKVGLKCRYCNEYAPTQPHMPAASPVIAQSPFQSVASDICEFGGNHYLVTVDRFSNWPTVSSAKSGTPASGTIASSAPFALFSLHLVSLRKYQVMEDQNTPLTSKTS